MRSILLPLGAMLTIAAAPPPPIAVTRVPPPIFNPGSVEEINRLPPVPIKVAVYLGRETLWTGALSVGSSPARLSFDEAVDMPSSCDVSGYRGKSRTIEVTVARHTATRTISPFPPDIAVLRPQAFARSDRARCPSSRRYNFPRVV